MFYFVAHRERTNERTNAAQWRLRERGALHAALLPYWCHAVLRGAPPTPVTVGPPLRPPPLPPLVAGVAAGAAGAAAVGAGQRWQRSQHHALEHAAAMLRRLLLGGTRGADVVADLAVLAGGLLSPAPPASLGHGGGGGAAAAAVVAVTPVLGRLALAVPRGGVEQLKRDIAPLSATQLVALLREAGADDG